MDSMCPVCIYSKKLYGVSGNNRGAFCVKNAPGADGYPKIEAVCGEFKANNQAINYKYVDCCSTCVYYEDREACAKLSTNKKKKWVTYYCVCTFYKRHKKYEFIEHSNEDLPPHDVDNLK